MHRSGGGEPVRLLGSLRDELPPHCPPMSETWQSAFFRCSVALDDDRMTIQHFPTVRAEVRRGLGLDG